MAKSENLQSDAALAELAVLLSKNDAVMHDNQLVRIANLVAESNIQFIASILKDKLFRIESQQNPASQ